MRDGASLSPLLEKDSQQEGPDGLKHHRRRISPNETGAHG